MKAQPGFLPYTVEEKAHPVMKLVNDARKELRQWAGALGLLPTTVGKVNTVPMPTDEDADDALLARMERRFDVVTGGKR